MPANVFAINAPTFSDGKGIQEEPRLISNSSDLVGLSNFVNSVNATQFDKDNCDVGNSHGYYFKQTVNVDLNGISWNQIGYSGEYYFLGNYDSSNYFILNANSLGKNDDEGYAISGIFG